jgi:LuxR family maltose regulon positive regulatory protein
MTMAPAAPRLIDRGDLVAAGLGRHREALEEIVAAEGLRSRLAGSHALAGQITGWKIATQARLGMTGEARAALESLTDAEATAGEIRNAHAAICLAEGDPAAALEALQEVLAGAASAIGVVTVVEAQLLAAHAHHALGDQRAANLGDRARAHPRRA